jgi:hypothetical protein
MVRTKNDDGSVTLSADEFALVLEALHLAKELCLDLEARTSLDGCIVEACLLRLVERLEAQGLR